MILQQEDNCKNTFKRSSEYSNGVIDNKTPISSNSSSLSGIISKTKQLTYLEQVKGKNNHEAAQKQSDH